MNNRASRVVKTFYVSSLFSVLAGLVFAANIILKPVSPKVELGYNSSASNQTVAVLGQQTNSQATKLIVKAVVGVREGNLLPVSVEVTNSSKTRLEFSPGLQLKMTDKSSAQEYDIVAPLGKVFYSGGPLEPGASSKGTVYFEAPVDRSLVLVYSEDGIKSSVAEIQ